MTFNPFKEDNERFSGRLERYATNESSVSRLPIPDGSICGAAFLSVMIQTPENLDKILNLFSNQFTFESKFFT